jgi:hypothetical protein
MRVSTAQKRLPWVSRRSLWLHGASCAAAAAESTVTRPANAAEADRRDMDDFTSKRAGR